MTIKELSNPGDEVKVYGLYGKTGKLIGIKKMRGYVCDFETAGALAPVAIGRLFLYVESKPSRAVYPGRKKEKMTAYEKSLNITEFFTVDSTRRHDIFVTYHSTANDAIKAAESDWNHLTKAEQKTATVSAWRVIQDNIRPDLVDSDRPWWEATSDRQDLLVKFPDDK